MPLFNPGIDATGGTVTGNLSIGGNETVSGTLGVTGLSTLGGGANLNGYSQVNASFGVTGDSTVLGNMIISVAGSGLQVKEGANAKAGTAVLNGTTEVTIATTAVTASSRVQLTIQAPGGTVGSPYVSSRVAGTSFGVKSTNAADSSTVAWLIVEPA